MPRYIIECDDPTDIFFGMRAIKNLAESGDAVAILEFDNGSLWYVKETKAGYSARTAKKSNACVSCGAPTPNDFCGFCLEEE